MHAVLTGDLIGSTAAARAHVEATMGLLAQTATEIAPDTRFTRFRGDGWQLYLGDPGRCLWASLWILARLRAQQDILGTRISVGIGGAEALGERDLSAASGGAFTASGHGLDAMAAAQILAIAGAGVDPMQRVVFAFCAARASRWSPEQAQVIAMDFGRQSRASIAKALGISRQAVDARLHAAGKRLLDEANAAVLDHYEKAGRCLKP